MTGGWSNIMVILWVTGIPLFLLVAGIVSLFERFKSK